MVLKKVTENVWMGKILCGSFMVELNMFHNNNPSIKPEKLFLVNSGLGSSVSP